MEWALARPQPQSRFMLYRASQCQSHVTFPLPQLTGTPAHERTSISSRRATSCSTSQLTCPPRQNFVSRYSPSNMSPTSIESHPAPRESFVWPLMKPEPLRSAVVESPLESGSIARQWSAKSRRAGSTSDNLKSIQLDRDEVVPLQHRTESERRKHQLPPLCAVASR